MVEHSPGRLPSQKRNEPKFVPQNVGDLRRTSSSERNGHAPNEPTLDGFPTADGSARWATPRRQTNPCSAAILPPPAPVNGKRAGAKQSQTSGRILAGNRRARLIQQRGYETCILVVRGGGEPVISHRTKPPSVPAGNLTVVKTAGARGSPHAHEAPGDGH